MFAITMSKSLFHFTINIVYRIEHTKHSSLVSTLFDCKKKLYTDIVYDKKSFLQNMYTKIWEKVSKNIRTYLIIKKKKNL